VTLADDPQVRAVFDGRTRWCRLRHEHVVGSTNDVALAELGDGAPPGLVVTADRQRAGRGRRGRAWLDDVVGAGGPVNLAVTATAPTPRRPGLTPLVAGISVAAAADELGVHTGLKWPNDVLADGEKLAGILVERHRTTGGDVVLIGCGVNVDWRGVPRDPALGSWTSLAEVIGDDAPRARVLAGLLHHLDAWLTVLAHDPAEVLAEYRRRSLTLGSKVRVTLPSGDVLEGVAVEIDADGRLIVRRPEGGATDDVVVAAGDVVHVRAV
jgi:BirA family transcriptional regulator, biotin operon repressor / biotin---[acetyl-CoA-carboxylase] ligase